MGALTDESGRNDNEVEALARLRVSCLPPEINNVSGMVMRIMPIKTKIPIFLFIDYIIYRIEE